MLFCCFHEFQRWTGSEVWVGQQQTFGSQRVFPVGQQAWVPGHGLFWVCWILLTVGQILVCGIVLFFFMYFGCLLFWRVRDRHA